MKIFLKIYILLIIPIFFLSCTGQSQSKEIVEVKPSIILLVGDGMGLSQLSTAFYYGDMDPNFARFKEIGLIKTSSSKHKITDSAAAATAFACGEKTYNGAVGLDSDSTIIPNLVEILSTVGYNTGLISTSSITHATPAGFYAHVTSRSLQFEIAENLVTSEVDFFAGGGTSWFKDRKDGKDLITELENNGFTINADIENVEMEAKNKYGFLLAENGMPKVTEDRGSFLPDYTKLALDYFTKSEDSFFLMIEGSQIDWAGHDKNPDYLIAEVIDFDKAVGVALDYAEQHGNTLVIVLADHETGGFALGIKDGDYAIIKPEFATSGHSTTLIPVMAFGPGCEDFKGIYENNRIFHKILNVASN